MDPKGAKPTNPPIIKVPSLKDRLSTFQSKITAPPPTKLTNVAPPVAKKSSLPPSPPVTLVPTKASAVVVDKVSIQNNYHF
jgi:hypothetical protein